jgi:hypothetical protein
VPPAANLNPRQPRSAEECKYPSSSKAFAVCSDEQRALGLQMARKLHGGAPLRMSPCDIFPYIRGRTLWLVGCVRASPDH